MPDSFSKPPLACAVKLALTGGGTAGHVMPHIAMLPVFAKKGWEVIYIGSVGIERDLIAKTNVRFYTIAAGKLRRYFSVRNLIDVVKVLWGILQALAILVRERPNLVFSKGGFVSVPVAVAGFILKIPVVSHESDLTPGLANKIISRFSNVILTSFPETSRFVPKAKLVGIPIRHELTTGQRDVGNRLCGFTGEENLQTILVMGGSQGAQRINDALYEALPELLAVYRIIHITGKAKGRAFAHPRYKAFEFLSEELKDVLAAADFVVSRAGANSIFELKALAKTMLLVPLEVGSRGDQVDNAASFVKAGWAKVLRESELSPTSLKAAIEDLRQNGADLRAVLSKAASSDPAAAVAATLESFLA